MDKSGRSREGSTISYFCFLDTRDASPAPAILQYPTPAPAKPEFTK
jgi:hypothetical protein